MGSVVAEWSTLRKSGTYVAWMSTHLQLGPIITMPIAGGFCNSEVGWPALYYIFGVLTLLFYTLFFWFYEDSAAMHK